MPVRAGEPTHAGVGNAPSNSILQKGNHPVSTRPQFRRVDLEVIVPHLCCSRGFHYLHIDLRAFTDVSNLALDKVERCEVAANGAHIDGLAFVRRREVLRDYVEHSRSFSEHRSQISGNRGGELLLLE